jgi:hypothetical protein
MPIDDEENKDSIKAEGADGDDKLEDIAQTEQEYLQERLREELGREPTEEELNEWQRQHTEGY